MNDMIAISVSIADTAGALVLKMTQDSRIKGGTRRVSRTKTLDGGCAIYDGGFSHADRTWTIEAIVSDATWDILFAIVSAYSLIYVAIAEGFFVCCVEHAVRKEDKATLSILVKEKIV